MPETLIGHIEPYSEQQIGPVPIFVDESKSETRFNYALRDGDILTLFNDAARQKPIWGPTVLKFKHEHLWHDYFPEGIKERRWSRLMGQHKPATVVIDPKNKAEWDALTQKLTDSTPIPP